MRPTLRAILRAVAAEAGIQAADLLGDDRHRHITRTRQLCCHLMRELTDASLTAIGAAMRLDHTTVLYAHRVTAKRLATDDEIQDLHDRILRRLSNATVDAPEPVEPVLAAPAPKPAAPELARHEEPPRALYEPVLIGGYGPLSRAKLAEQEARFAAAMMEALA